MFLRDGGEGEKKKFIEKECPNVRFSYELDKNFLHSHSAEYSGNVLLSVSSLEQYLRVRERERERMSCSFLIWQTARLLHMLLEMLTQLKESSIFT